ncbi:MAG: OmpA family protein [Candidatus Omnitrophota bacterium]
MRIHCHFWGGVIAVLLFGLVSSGCAVNFYTQSPRNKEKIKNLEAKITDLEAEREKEQKRFKEVELELKKKFKPQIADKSISLERDERGLVIIVSDDILFDSGKAEFKKDAHTTLDKVAKILEQKVPDKNIGVSGHTDNVPIKFSKWKSNWELSTARATNVVHHLAEKGVLSAKLSATGYGEHRPLDSNATETGRSKNRRVEILILPEFVEKRSENIMDVTTEAPLK